MCAVQESASDFCKDIDWSIQAKLLYTTDADLFLHCYSKQKLRQADGAPHVSYGTMWGACLQLTLATQSYTSFVTGDPVKDICFK